MILSLSLSFFFGGGEEGLSISQNTQINVDQVQYVLKVTGTVDIVITAL